MNKRIGLFVNGYDAEEKLKAGINDISRIYSVLTDEKLGQCDRTLSKMKSNIKSKKDFRDILDSVLEKLHHTDQFIFYFSGHGDHKGSNYHLKFNNDLYSFQTLLTELESYEINKAIIILDSCFSGSAVIKKSNSEIYLPKLPEGIAILTSSTEGEFSYEKDDKTFSVFTDLMCQCIESGNNNISTKDDLITLDDVITYVKQNNKHKGKQQQPKYKIENSDNTIWIAKNITTSFKKEKIKNTNSNSSITELEKIDYEKAKFTEKVNHEVKIADIDWGLVELYISKKEIKIDLLQDKNKILEELIFTKHGNILNAVVLNFATRPDKFIHQAYVMITIDKLSRKEFYGNNKTLLDKTVEYILSKIDEFSYYIKTDRIDDYVVPHKLLREAISNALTHRCYEDCKDPIKINISKKNKQIEIKSPGNFLGDYQKMLAEDDNDFSTLRDARMGDYIMNLSVAEGLGRGFDHYRAHIKAYGKEYVVFDNDDNFTKVILKFQQDKENNQPNAFKYPKVLTPLLGYDSTQFIGREVEFDYLKYNFGNESIISITGMGGVGKTKLATTYLNINKDEFDYLGFIDCRDSIKNGFISAFQISLKLEEENYENIFDEILIKLQNLQGTKLLILDDIINIEKQEKELQAISNLVHSGFKILITSREKISNFETLEISSLTVEEAKELFQSISKIKDDEVLDELLNFVGYLPLAVQLIAKTLVSNKSLTPKKLLDKVNRGEFSQIRLSRHESLLNLLNNTFDASSLDNKELSILQQFSILPSLEINYKQLEKIFNRINDEEFSFLLDELVQKGWLNYRDNVYLMHPIIQSFIKQFKTPTFENTQKIYSYFTKLLKNTNDISKIVQNFVYLPYIDTIVDFASKNLITIIDNKKSTLADFYENTAKLYKEYGNYKKALLLYKNVLKINEGIKTKENLVPIYNNLSEIYQIMGKFETAQVYNEKIVKLQKNIFDENDLVLISSLYNQANILVAKGQLKEAESIYQDILLMQLRNSEKNPSVFRPTLATTYNNLAHLYQSMEEYEKALHLYQKALDINESILGSKHPSTATIYNNLAHLYQSMGEYEKALHLYQKALDINESIFSGDHPEVINSQKSLIEINTKLNTSESINNIEDEIKSWFFENYDDPANLLPYESKEGGYIYIWGGPYELREVIHERFYSNVDEEIINRVIEDIENEYGDIEWSKQPEKYLSLNIHLDYETSELSGASGMFQVISIEDSEFDYDMTELIDVGLHYHEISEVIREVSKKTSVPFENIYYEIV